MAEPQIAAVHMDGGNLYDDIRLDISASHATMDAVQARKRSIRKAALVDRLAYLGDGFLQKYRLLDFLTTTGLRRQWFKDFYSYWVDVLDGRPLVISDFFPLLHDYRKRQQSREELNWESPTAHVHNWQNPVFLYHTLTAARKVGLFPIVGYQLWPYLKPNMTILEYGCGVAPYYYCYRRYFSHLKCQWLLVDIPNFTFHYAKYLYRQDAGVELLTIQPADFTNPLKDRSDLDVIILSTVFEHLDEPTFVADYLLTRLKSGGIFVFDYIQSEGRGLDTPTALAKRRECLTLILERVDVLRGKININENVGLCITRKK